MDSSDKEQHLRFINFLLAKSHLRDRAVSSAFSRAARGSTVTSPLTRDIAHYIRAEDPSFDDLQISSISIQVARDTMIKLRGRIREIRLQIKAGVEDTGRRNRLILEAREISARIKSLDEDMRELEKHL